MRTRPDWDVNCSENCNQWSKNLAPEPKKPIC